jgi:hypothetical protein
VTGTALTSRGLALAAAVALAGDTAAAQTAASPEWSVSVSAATYILPDTEYVQPTITAERGRLHLEGRFNYENLDTGSLWIGANFSGGGTLMWAVTPMLGGVFGDTTAIAPGAKASLGWRALELYGESEYVIDTGTRDDRYFYMWSELSLAPIDRFRFGLVTQRTRAYQSDRDIQRGLLAGVSFEHLDLTGYVFNPDDERATYVISVALRF